MIHRKRIISSNLRDVLFYQDHIKYELDYTYKKRLDLEMSKYGNIRNAIEYINEDNLHYTQYDMKPYFITPENAKELYKYEDLEFDFIPKEEYATGPDRVSKVDYLMNEDKYLKDLVHRIRDNKYKPKIMRRIIVKQSSTKERPLTIMCYEDKLVQKLLSTILTHIYDKTFESNSFAYRPNIGVKDAIKKVKSLIEHNNYRYVIEADIKSFFDTVDKYKLLQIVSKTIKDKRFTNLLKQSINTRYIYKSKVYDQEGIVQGGPLSPVLANIYLDHILDKWGNNTFGNKAKVIRYADDFIVLVKDKDNIEYIYKSIKKRLKKYNLKLSESKTKINSTSEGFCFLGHKITRINDTVEIGIDESRIPKKLEKFKEVFENMKYDYRYLERNQRLDLFCIRDYIIWINTKLLGCYEYYRLIDNYVEEMNKLYNEVIKIVREGLRPYSTSIDIGEYINIMYDPISYEIESGVRERKHNSSNCNNISAWRCRYTKM